MSEQTAKNKFCFRPAQIGNKVNFNLLWGEKGGNRLKKKGV